MEAEGTKAADPNALRGLSANPQQLTETLRQILADGYVGGLGTAHEQTGAEIASSGTLAAYASGIDWNTWVPGDANAALKVADGGLRQLLNDAGVTIRGIQDTTVDRLGNILAEGLGQGSSADEIARNMREFLDDPARADVIALTEGARAMCEGQSDEYQAQGFTGWEWIAHDGACDECLDNDGQQFGFDDEKPPAHPNCRCGISPTTDEAAAEPMPAEPEPAPEQEPTPEPAPVVPQPDLTQMPDTATALAEGATAPANTTFNFATFQDAVSYFAQFDIKVAPELEADGWTGAHLSDVAGAMWDAEIKNPGIHERLVEIDNGAHGTTLAAIRTYIYNRGPEKGMPVALEDRMGGSTLRLNKTLVRAWERNDWPANYNTATSLRDIITHEMAHVVEMSTAAELRGKWQTVLGAAMRKVGLAVDGATARFETLELIKRNISPYALEKRSEFFAEARVILNDPVRFNALPAELKEKLIALQKELRAKTGTDVFKADQPEDASIMAFTNGCTFGLPASYIKAVEEGRPWKPTA